MASCKLFSRRHFPLVAIALFLAFSFTHTSAQSAVPFQPNCGTSWIDASQNCHKHCHTEEDFECIDALGEGYACYYFTGCDETSNPTKEAEEIGQEEDVANDNRCGASWIDAMLRCGTPCPTGSECSDPFERCFAATNCVYPLESLVSRLVFKLHFLNWPNAMIMDSVDADIFVGAVTESLRGALADPGLALGAIEVGEQTAVEVEREGGGSRLDVSVIITADYRPPPEVDLGFLIEDAIDRDGAAVAKALREMGARAGRDHFSRLESVSANRDRSDRPTMMPTTDFLSLITTTGGGAESEPEAGPTSASTALAQPNCGTTWLDAAQNCHRHCPTGEDVECINALGEGYACFYYTGCGRANGPTVMPTPYFPSLSPTTGGGTESEPDAGPTSAPAKIIDSPTLPPSRGAVTSAPTSHAHSGVIYTGSRADLQLGGTTTSSYGYLWNIRTKPDSDAVLLTGFDFYTESTSDVTYELWTRVGSFEGFKGSFEGWSLIASGTTRGRGIGRYTSIPEETFSPVSIPGGGVGAGGVRAFYLTLDSLDLVYKFGDGRSESDSKIHAESAELEIWEGEGVLLYPFPDPNESHFYRYPRQYLGAIYYDRLPALSTATSSTAMAFATDYISSTIVNSNNTTVVEDGNSISTSSTEIGVTTNMGTSPTGEVANDDDSATSSTTSSATMDPVATNNENTVTFSTVMSSNVTNLFGANDLDNLPTTSSSGITTVMNSEFTSNTSVDGDTTVITTSSSITNPAITNPINVDSTNLTATSSAEVAPASNAAQSTSTGPTTNTLLKGEDTVTTASSSITSPTILNLANSTTSSSIPLTQAPNTTESTHTASTGSATTSVYGGTPVTSTPNSTYATEAFPLTLTTSEMPTSNSTEATPTTSTESATTSVLVDGSLTTNSSATNLTEDVTTASTVAPTKSPVAPFLFEPFETSVASRTKKVISFIVVLVGGTQMF